MILMTGWKGETDFIDPMCGSGTLPIEAALIARNISPGVFRKEFAFEKWPDFDQELFDTIYNDDSQEREFDHHIYGYDVEMKAVNTAKNECGGSRIHKIRYHRAQGLQEFHAARAEEYHRNEPSLRRAHLYSEPLGHLQNDWRTPETPVYGQRSVDSLVSRRVFPRNRIEPSIKIPVYNGSLECEFRRYQMFDGKLNDFRAEGGIVKTEDEKREMAQKHRFKRTAIQETTRRNRGNEEGDIRSFTFHSFEHNISIGGKENRKGKRGGRKNFRDNDRYDDERGSFRGGKKFEGKRFDKGNKGGKVPKKK